MRFGGLLQNFPWNRLGTRAGWDRLGRFAGETGARRVAFGLLEQGKNLFCLEGGAWSHLRDVGSHEDTFFGCSSRGTNRNPPLVVWRGGSHLRDNPMCPPRFVLTCRRPCPRWQRSCTTRTRSGSGLLFVRQFVCLSRFFVGLGLPFATRLAHRLEYKTISFLGDLDKEPFWDPSEISRPNGLLRGPINIKNAWSFGEGSDGVSDQQLHTWKEHRDAAYAQPAMVPTSARNKPNKVPRLHGWFFGFC